MSMIPSTIVSNLSHIITGYLGTSDCGRAAVEYRGVESFISQLVEDRIETICSLCDNRFKENPVELVCGHRYHYMCIREWRYFNRSCPQDQRTIREQQIRYPLITLFIQEMPYLGISPQIEPGIFSRLMQPDKIHGYFSLNDKIIQVKTVVKRQKGLISYRDFKLCQKQGPLAIHKTLGECGLKDYTTLHLSTITSCKTCEPNPCIH